MSRRVRIVIGLAVLSASLVLLIWGMKPLDKRINSQPISPSDLQLPTPLSLLIDPETVS